MVFGGVMDVLLKLDEDSPTVMSSIKVRTGGNECAGTIREMSDGSRPAKHHSGQVMTAFAVIDLDTECILSNSGHLPLAEIEIAGIWRAAEIEGIPRAPDFRTITLAYEK
jgi:hypothetical protein